jgi:hypothetical protein
METKRDEVFSAIRWINLMVGIGNIYFFQLGGGYSLLGIGILNIGVWAMTRRMKT